MERKDIPAGYVAFNGHVFTQREAERYNAIQAHIRRWIAAGREVPARLLDDSARTFKMIIGAA